MSSTLSALVITKNEERNIASCLDSLQWVDQLIVVDAESTDQTVDWPAGIRIRFSSGHGQDSGLRKILAWTSLNLNGS